MVRIGYTGDLHIEFLVSNLQEKHNRDFSIEEIALMFCDALNKVECDIAVVVGDTSHCPADIVRFFDAVDKKTSKPIYTVLGNHDYWNFESSIVPSDSEELPEKFVEAMEEWFKEKFAKYKNIKLLIAGDKHKHGGIKIIGDCGFSGNNFKFNYRQGIYRGTINNAIQEKELTDRWRKFYEREAFKGEKTLIITHHPPTDWGHGYDDFDEGSENRYYIFGHVHDLDERTSADVEIVKKDNYCGDAGNGYRKLNIDFKVVEIK
jgi:predicted phosphohydrolase